MGKSAPILFVFGLIAIGMTSSALAADETHLWTVQAVNTGAETVCDAFAQGAHKRPPYEFRFRRSKSDLLFIVSYDGKRLHDQSGDAAIVIDGKKHDLPAVASHFGTRNAFTVSLSPDSVDFSEFDRTIPIIAKFSGATFELSFLEADHLSETFTECLRFAHIQ
jgi:hypothetical protein